MKNSILLLLSIAFLAACSLNPANKTNFSIKGNISDNYSGYAHLFKRERGEWIMLDSVIAENGSFIFKGVIELPELYYITDSSKNNHTPVFVEQAAMDFSASSTRTETPDLCIVSMVWQPEEGKSNLRS